MDSKITKFIIVCDHIIATKSMAHTLCDLLSKNGKRLEGYIKPGCCNINANGLSIFIYSKAYRHLDGLSCDYFSISVTDMDSYLKWRHRLEPHGKELMTFDALKEEITMACSLTIDSVNYINNGIQNVIFNGPATIVLWNDGTKTVVKRGKNDTYDPEKGFAMAISKKALGNQGNYYDVFKKWLPNITATSKTIHDDEEKNNG